MKFFIKELFQTGKSEKGHQYFVRFGKGHYRRRFLISVQKTSKIKIKGSFELANAFVDFVEENKEIKFSGKIVSKEKIPGKDGKKKAGSFIYEVSDVQIKEYGNAYSYLLDANSGDIVLKIKKALPKPGKDAEKIDDKFCTLELDLKYWPKIKEAFFWDIPDSVKKAKVEHDLDITDIVLPLGEKDPAKIRELAKRKGTITRRLNIDGNEKKEEREFEC